MLSDPVQVKHFSQCSQAQTCCLRPNNAQIQIGDLGPKSKCLQNNNLRLPRLGRGGGLLTRDLELVRSARRTGLEVQISNAEIGRDTVRSSTEQKAQTYCMGWEAGISMLMEDVNRSAETPGIAIEGMRPHTRAE